MSFTPCLTAGKGLVPILILLSA